MKNNEMPSFTGRNVPINEIAQATGKDRSTYASDFRKVFFVSDMLSRKTVQASITISVPTKKYGKI